MSAVEPGDHFPGGTLKTAAKLKILEWYLDEYVAIMDKNWGDYWYVDTHAGTGQTLCSNGELIDGSAIRVLDQYGDRFSRFYFYELDPDHFQTLHRTLSDRFGLEFDVSPARVGDADFAVARCDDPYIRIMNLDSNEGAQFLSEHATNDSHWFTFVDPRGLTAKRTTLDALIARGNMDILINYQTTGVMRNAAEGAEHGDAAVTRTLGDDEWPADASEDDYVELFRERLERNEEWEIQTKDMRDPHDTSYRFDLVFASSNGTAHRIMNYIMNERTDLWEEAGEELGQAGLGRFTP